MDEKKGGAIPRLLDDFVINHGGGCCLYNSDCLDVLRTLPDGSVDMILQDPPYAVTACGWDKAINLETLWPEWKRIIKPTGVIVMTAQQPLVTDLISMEREFFRQELIWDKGQGGDFLNANKRHLKAHENILLFGKAGHTYNPQITTKPVENRRYKPAGMTADWKNNITDLNFQLSKTYDYTKSYPLSVLRYSLQMAECNSASRVHPTQKPVDLFRYLIRTYTNEGETVFDGYGGSGTTAVACIKENRKYIVCEKEAEYIEVTKKRIDEATRQGNLFSAVGCCPHDL